MAKIYDKIQSAKDILEKISKLPERERLEFYTEMLDEYSKIGLVELSDDEIKNFYTKKLLKIT